VNCQDTSHGIDFWLLSKLKTMNNPRQAGKGDDTDGAFQHHQY